MIFWFSSIVVVCLTALAIAMLLTGHDALMERAIVAWEPVAKDIGMAAPVLGFFIFGMYLVRRSS